MGGRYVPQRGGGVVGWWCVVGCRWWYPHPPPWCRQGPFKESRFPDRCNFPNIDTTVPLSPCYKNSTTQRRRHECQNYRCKSMMT